MITSRIPCFSAVVALALAGLGAPAMAESESRAVQGFDQVVLEVPAELQIEQGAQEALTLDAEPAVLRKITTEVHGRRLHIGLAPGRIETRQPIRMRLQVRQLRAFESRTAGAVTTGPLQGKTLRLGLTGGGSIHVAQLDTQELVVRISGAGDVAIGGGQVRQQQLAISGVGNYAAPALRSERAEVAIDGNGQAHVAASGSLDVRIGGVGKVRYRGEPVLTQSIRGIGTVERD